MGQVDWPVFWDGVIAISVAAIAAAVLALLVIAIVILFGPRR